MLDASETTMADGETRTAEGPASTAHAQQMQMQELQITTYFYILFLAAGMTRNA